MSAQKDSSADECPKCGYLPSYTGGYCFRCGIFRPSKRVNPGEADEITVTEFMERSFGTRLSDLEQSEEELNETLDREIQFYRHKKRMPVEHKPIIITEENRNAASILLRCVVEKLGDEPDGQLIRAIVPAWQAVADQLGKDWSHAFDIPSRAWEEIIAATFDKAGYDEVLLTSRSGDHGRDVIAIRRGVCCVRIIGSVKAYKPSHLVSYDDIRALAGVLLGDPKATKGLITTTSDFPPNLYKDPFLSSLMPYRLETMNGIQLQKWLRELH